MNDYSPITHDYYFVNKESHLGKNLKGFKGPRVQGSEGSPGILIISAVFFERVGSSGPFRANEEDPG